MTTLFELKEILLTVSFYTGIFDIAGLHLCTHQACPVLDHSEGIEVTGSPFPI